MHSPYLNRLNADELQQLKEDLLKIQCGRCFIDDEVIDLKLHEVHIDHVIPLKSGGKDDPSNFALTHSWCNESKQDANLRIARVLAKFKKIRNSITDRGPNLSDIFFVYGGSKYELSYDYDAENEDFIRYSFPQLKDNNIYVDKIYRDELSGFRYFFAVLPIEYIFHDDKINPRSIGQNISKLVKEFYLKFPQLHISLGWIDSENKGKCKIRLFDGQHKAAAQILLGIKRLPMRIFIISSQLELDALITANTHAGTNLKQIAFDKSVQSHLGTLTPHR